MSIATPAQYITIEHNTTAPLVVTIPWQNLTASGLSGYTAIWFIAKYSLLDLDASAPISKTLGSGIVVTTAGDNTSVNGVITITIAAADTASMPISTGNLSLFFSCGGKDSGGNDWPICQGKLTITPNASRAT